MDSQADAIREGVAKVLKLAAANGAVQVVFRAENVSAAMAGSRTNQRNVISALTSEKMRDQTGFGPGISDREYNSSAALISFELDLNRNG